MSEAPLPRFDPARLREERHAVDLGPDVSESDTIAHAPDDESGALLDEPTSGMTPPAR